MRGPGKGHAGAPHLSRPVPMPLFRTPWGPTEHMIAMLVHHERGMADATFREHSETILTYLRGRLDLLDEPRYVELPDQEEAHGSPDHRDTGAGAGVAAVG